MTVVGALFVSEMTSLNISLSLPLFSLLFLAALVGSSHGGASLACRFVATVTVAFEFAVDAIDAVVPALAKRTRPFLEHGLLSIGAATTTMVDFARVVARFEVSRHGGLSVMGLMDDDIRRLSFVASLEDDSTAAGTGTDAAATNAEASGDKSRVSTVVVVARR